MFGFFRREEKYKKTIIATSEEVRRKLVEETEFLKKANTCPECGYENNHPTIRREGDGRKYTVPISCRSCGCQFEYERPYGF